MSVRVLECWAARPTYSPYGPLKNQSKLFKSREVSIKVGLEKFQDSNLPFKASQCCSPLKGTVPLVWLRTAPNLSTQNFLDL